MMIRRLAALFLIVPVPFGAQAEPACHYAAVDPAASGSSAGPRFDFGAADDPTRPTAWQGPIAISGASGSATPSCMVDPDVGIIERPIWSDGQHLLVTTYSGSNRVVFAVATSNCAVLWHSAAFAGNVALRPGALSLGGKTVRLGKQCVPLAH